MKIARVLNNDLANGPGIRLSVFVSGCPHKCPGCHAQSLWDYSIGEEWTEDFLDPLQTLLQKNGVHRGLSILGGEPLAPYNIQGVEDMIRGLKERIPDLNIWLWTGYLWDQIKQHSVLNFIDGVVEGPFIQAFRKGDLLWRGSSNQNIYIKEATEFIKMT